MSYFNYTILGSEFVLQSRVLRVNPSTMSKILINYISRSIRSNQSSCIHSLPGPNILVQARPLLYDVGRATACRHRASPPPCLPLAALLVSSSRFRSTIFPMDPNLVEGFYNRFFLLWRLPICESIYIICSLSPPFWPVPTTTKICVSKPQICKSQRLHSGAFPANRTSRHPSPTSPQAQLQTTIFDVSTSCVPGVPHITRFPDSVSCWLIRDKRHFCIIKIEMESNVRKHRFLLTVMILQQWKSTKMRIVPQREIREKV